MVAKSKPTKSGLDGLHQRMMYLRKEEYYDRAALTACTRKVVAAVKKELASRPDDTKLLLMLADAQGDLGLRGRRQAIQTYDRVIAVGGRTKGEALQQKGMELYELYRAEFNQLRSVTDKTNPKALTEIADCLRAGLAARGGRSRTFAKGLLRTVTDELGRTDAVLRVQAQIEAGDLDRALSGDLADHDRAKLLMDKGDQLLAAGRIREAERSFEASIPYFSNELQSSRAVQRLGQAALVEFGKTKSPKDLERALAKLRSAAGHDTYNQETQLLYCRALALSNDAEGALKVLKVAMRQNCDWFRTVKNLKDLKAWLKSYPEMSRVQKTKPFAQFLQKLGTKT